MSKLISLKFTDFNIDNFTSFLTNASIDNANHSIDVSPDSVYCKAHPLDKKFIKFTSVPGIDILKFTNYPKGTSSIVLKLQNLKKVKEAMNVFTLAEKTLVNGEMFYYTDQDGNAICNHMKFSADKMNINVKFDNADMIQYMKDEQWKKYSNRNDIVMKFDLDQRAIKLLKQYVKLDKHLSIVIDARKDTLIFKSRNGSDEEGLWDFEHSLNYQNTDGKEVVYNMSKIILEDIIDKTFYTVYVTKNIGVNNTEHLSFLFYNSDDSIIMSPVAYDKK